VYWEEMPREPAFTKGYIALCNENGDTLWTKVVLPFNYPDSSTKVFSAIQTSDNSILASGWHSNYGFCLVKTVPYLTTGLEQKPKVITQSFSLSQNYPNPFNPITTIEFDLPKTSEVSLKVFNILGEEVATLVSGRLSTGSYSYEWSRPAGIASGVYLYRLETSGYVKTRKMILMK
jgi:hypothetical protein